MKKKSEPKRHPPGSNAAISAGCSCPVLDNCHGRGYMGLSGIYVFSGGCDYHVREKKEEKDEPESE